MTGRKVLSVLILAAFILPNNLTLNAQEEEQKLNPALEKAIGQFKHENYEEALSLFKKAREEDPKSTVAAYYLGLTYKQLQDYKAAIPNLTDAVTAAPKIKGALIELVDCYYQTNKLDEAKKWIREAETEGIRPAQVAFLKGLVLAKEGSSDEAIRSFENAKALDPAMTQACDYQIGIAHLKNKRFVDAQKAFKEVIIRDPGTNMANFANAYMDALEKREEAMRPIKLTAGFAVQYDDNVVLKPDDSSLAADISDQSDYRYVYTARGEYDKRFNDNFGIKLQDSVYYGKQNKIGFYNTFTNTATVQPAFYSEESLLALPVGFTYTQVNDRTYLTSPSAGALYNRVLNASNMAQLFLNYQYKDYRWSPSASDENRDGSDLAGSIGWFLFYAKNRGFLNLRYTLNEDWTKGNNWEYIGNRGTATLLVPIGDKFRASVTGDIFHQNFSNTHSVYSKKRKDTIYTVSPLLAYKFYKDWEIQLQYSYVKDKSNISVYEYTRNLYSAGIEVKF